MTTVPATNTRPVGLEAPSTPIKINVGGAKGGHPALREWKVIDLRENADIRIDITRQELPFDDGTVDVVFCSHTIEHIQPTSLGFVLSEFLRVLKPASEGGVLRLLVPDIKRACRAYVEGNSEFFEKADLTHMFRNAPIGGKLASFFYSSSAVGNGHVHCFDFEYLSWWLQKTGFADIKETPFQGSQLPELRGEAFDRHPQISLCVEARKPDA